ncbi:MAG: PQQ-dependent sugar dehydrogenase [Adhaeribacter sp.]
MASKFKAPAHLVGLLVLALAGCSPKQAPGTTQQLPETARQPVTAQQPEPAAPAAGPVAASTGQDAGPYSRNAQVIAQGQALFQQNCAACHGFKQKGIGPNLSGVTSQVSHAWITRFVRNAPEVITSGDDRARRLVEEYNQVMPPFTSLSDADLQALVSFIHTQKAAAAPASTTHLGEALADPIPEKISPSGLSLVLEEVMQAPATSDKVPLARINKMRVLKGGKSDRHFIQELRGLIYEIKDNQLRVYMDITRERPNFIPQPGLATGFGSFAFHPEFYKNGLLYTTHTEKAGTAPADFAVPDSIRKTLQWVLMEWTVTNPAAPTFAGTGREMMRVDMVTQVHGVQEITFSPLAKPGSPDYGLLYIGVGDGGAAEHGAYYLCNSNKTIWSSVLRIDPRGRNSKNGRYGIPAANPFAGDQDPGTLGEVFARGFRNPNRISWSPDGKMIITEIGLNNIEEINLGQAGADYGWPAREGTFLLNYRGKMDKVYALPADDSKYNFTYPVAQFDHDEGNAISSGFVYEGPGMPLLQGQFVFGDIVSGRVFLVSNKNLRLGQQTPVKELSLQIGGKTTTLRAATGSRKTDLRFGLGPKKELYIFTKSDGRIYRVTNCLPKTKS